MRTPNVSAIKLTVDVWHEKRIWPKTEPGGTSSFWNEVLQDRHALQNVNPWEWSTGFQTGR